MVCDCCATTNGVYRAHRRCSRHDSRSRCYGIEPQRASRLGLGESGSRSLLSTTSGRGRGKWPPQASQRCKVEKGRMKESGNKFPRHRRSASARCSGSCREGGATATTEAGEVVGGTLKFRRPAGRPRNVEAGTNRRREGEAVGVPGRRDRRDQPGGARSLSCAAHVDPDDRQETGGSGTHLETPSEPCC